jgi:hypothetical protein
MFAILKGTKDSLWLFDFVQKVNVHEEANQSEMEVGYLFFRLKKLRLCRPVILDSNHVGS